MDESEIEHVLRNWIEQALSHVGQPIDEMNAAAWVTRQFTAWWRSQVQDSLEFAELSASQLREELHKPDIPGSLDEALHELTHLQDALADLRRLLGMDDDADQSH